MQAKNTKNKAGHLTGGGGGAHPCTLPLGPPTARHLDISVLQKYLCVVNKGLTGLTRLPLFRGVSVYDLQSLALTSISLRDLPFL